MPIPERDELGFHFAALHQIMGHSSLAMIQNVYAHLTPSDAYEAMLRALEGQ
jgi:integrase